MKTLIRNGQIITATDNYKADILIEGETVSVIGAKLDMEADVTIDAADRLVIPGGIDPHTHMELPFGGTTASDDFTTARLLRAHGGTTSSSTLPCSPKARHCFRAVENWHKSRANAPSITASSDH